MKRKSFDGIDFRKTVAGPKSIVLSPPSLSARLCSSSHRFIDDHGRARGIGSSRSSRSSGRGLLQGAAVAFDDELRRLLRRHCRIRIDVVDNRRRNRSFSSSRAGRGRCPLPELLERRGRHRTGVEQKKSASASKSEKKRRKTERTKRTRAVVCPLSLSLLFSRFLSRPVI